VVHLAIHDTSMGELFGVITAHYKLRHDDGYKRIYVSDSNVISTNNYHLPLRNPTPDKPNSIQREKRKSTSKQTKSMHDLHSVQCPTIVGDANGNNKVKEVKKRTKKTPKSHVR
jgi:hypothetical protein